MPSEWDGTPWRKFERIVAALHKLRDVGADVQWNEKIKGRQIDVAIRFERGGYRYLVLIECKNLATAVPVGDVEAFVTKSASLAANKAIMVSANGFQKGAKEVAERESLELYHLTERQDAWPEQFISAPGPGIHVHGVVLWCRGRLAPVVLADDSRLIQNLRFSPRGWPRNNLNLTDIVRHGMPQLSERTQAGERNFRIQFPKGCAVHGLPPRGAEELRSLDFKAQPHDGAVRHRVRPPNVPLRSYVYENVLTAERSEHFGGDLPIGLDNQFRAGAFYRNIFDTAYKCESVEGSSATMLAFLHEQGAPITVRCVIDTKHAPLYVELTSAEEIARWEGEAQRIPAADATAKSRQPGGQK